ncbi:MAG: DUF1080 domain-containing protein [Verrucomicrobia bacterium]|nr:MAG: DUF1080 domain-containing protein [Verrucomicrobiota bacterium]
MKPTFLLFSFLSIFISPLLAEEKSIFNGKDLAGWSGAMEFWSVRDGAITGETTAEKRTAQNTFLVLDGIEVADFELRFSYRIMDVQGASKGFGNSGVQYRSKLIDAAAFIVAGYQADFECGETYSGILYEERGRGILAQRGQKVTIQNGPVPEKPSIIETGKTGDSAVIQAAIKPADWNEYRIVAKGGHLQHFINGKLTVEVTDESSMAAKSGILALQLHAGEPMTVQFKDLFLTEK